VDTASGEYSWTYPSGVFGSGGPLVAVGVLPHANEPLGSAFTSTLPGYDGFGRIAPVGPIDPPPYVFDLPTDPVGYAAGGYLQPLTEQAEFAHCATPVTPAQRRAANLRAELQALRPDAFVLIHNDVGAIAPYIYANRSWPAVTRRIQEAFPGAPALGAAWTTVLDQRTYAYFPPARVGVDGTECAGRYIEKVLGIPTLTVELPMFEWGADLVRLAVAQAMGEWIARGATYGGDTPRLVREVSAILGDRHVPMVPAPVNAQVVWSALEGVFETLTTGSAQRPQELAGHVHRDL
jgi:hypothetical protein